MSFSLNSLFTNIHRITSNRSYCKCFKTVQLYTHTYSKNGKFFFFTLFLCRGILEAKFRLSLESSARTHEQETELLSPHDK